MDFNIGYDRDVLKEFFRDEFFPDDYQPCHEDVELVSGYKYIKHATMLGQYPEFGLVVYEFQHESFNDPRVSLTKETFRFMERYSYTDLIALYVSPGASNYRLSYVTLGFIPEGKKVKIEFSNPHRYSYFLGPDAKVQTPSRYLVKKGKITGLEDLKERFSVEVVNKEFYREIAALFTRLVGGKRQEGKQTTEYEPLLKLPSVIDHLKMQEFAVRMIGRVVFGWFLKKKSAPGGKPLIPEEVLSLNAVKNNPFYYHSVLEKLFFQVLNTPVDKRRDDVRLEPFKDIPFLNGGLFEPHTDDIYEVDQYTGLSKHLNTVIIPDEWMAQFFELLETYNFTIDENNSMDIELSVDPEMLGRIFENLLAEINPETGETARKSTGSYYTPRPIVEYMVDESLKQYLKTGTRIPDEKLDRLLSFSLELDDVFSQEETRSVIDALDQVKIIDPACGSGAFPMGVLQKLVLILEKVDPRSETWLEKQLERIDVSVRKYVRQTLEKENFGYIRKMGLIRNAIYGVDIQQIAVEISKLRVFLSLVVDSTIDDSLPDRGIKPLPNLEFKFVCADSLVKLPQEGKTKSSGLFEDRESIKQLKKLREEYFESFGQDKEKIKQEFKKTQDLMFKQMIEKAGHSQFIGKETLALSAWEPFSDKSSQWFESDWMFGVKGGFDIVIANPPYVINSKVNGLDYKFTNGNSNLYAAFIELSYNFIKEDGIFNLIIPSTWLAGNNFLELRKVLLTKKIINKMVQLPYDMFNVYIDTLILEGIKSMKKPGIAWVFQFMPKERFNANIKLEEFNYKYWLDDDNLTIFLNKDIVSFIRKYQELPSQKLGKIAKVQRGTLPPKSFIEIGENSSNKTIPWFNNQVYRYLIKRGEPVYVEYDKLKENKPIELFEKKKILGRQLISRQFRLQFTYLEEIFAFKKNLYAIYDLNEDYHYYFLLAFLNSKFFSFLKVQHNSSGQRDDFPAFSLLDYKNFLIPKVDSITQAPYIEIVEKILQLTQDSSTYLLNKEKQLKVKAFDREIDDLVYRLYNLTAEEIALIEKEIGGK